MKPSCQNVELFKPFSTNPRGPFFVPHIIAAILLYPLGCVLFQSVLTKEGGIGLANYTSLLSQSSFWTALANSFTVSGISAAIATLMAFFCAYGLHFTRIRPGVKKVIQIIVLLPLFLPSITYGFAVVSGHQYLGHNGKIN